MGIRTLLVANRAEIARRIIRTAREMGIRTVAVYVPEDAGAPHTREADVAYAIDDYLDVAALVDVARRAVADAVHPGYGFVSERGAAARAFEGAGIAWVGPPADVIDALGDKIRAKELMAAAGVPLLPGGSVDAAAAIGCPVLVKAAAGGGGRGMRLVTDPADLEEAVAAAGREALAAFGDGTVFLERWLAEPRHVEVQILADSHGGVIHLGERECSIQRRHQKVVEESPSPGIDPDLRARMTSAAVAGAQAVGYVGAGTWEFLVADGEFFFLEVNTRLQVEHPVTEAVTGLDLVRLQLEIAGGATIPAVAELHGHAIEVRIVAEDPTNEWLPSTGTLHRFVPGTVPGIRYDLGFESGSVISPRFDSLLGKVIAHAPSREEAADRLAMALDGLEIHGVTTNRELLATILREEDFLAGRTTTAYLDHHRVVGSEGPLPVHAAAAALWHQALRRRGETLPSGWRNVRSQGQRTVWRAGDRDVLVEYVLEGDRFAATVDDAQLNGRVLSVGDDHIELEAVGLLCRYRCDAAGPSVWIGSPTHQITLVEVPRFASREAEAATRLGPTAPVPGTVIAVEVGEGDKVVAGQTLVVLEAMKLEHRIKAEIDAVVRSVAVGVGDKVDAHQVLVVLEDG